MSDSHSFFARSWFEIYQQLRAKAEASRGTSTVTTNGVTSATVPQTTVSDAFAISLVFDTAVNDHARGEVVARWIWDTDRLAGESDDSHDIYPGNRSFWDTLAVAATELDRVRAALPAQSVIDDAMRELDVTREEPEDAPASGSSALFVTVFSEPTWKVMALRQYAFFCMLRGEADGDAQSLATVPATTNADVLGLAHYWTDQLVRIGRTADDAHHRLVYARWRNVLHHVIRHAKHAPARDEYSLNAEFWIALLTLATETDARDEAPTPWTFHLPDACDRRRNAAPVDTGATLDFPAAKTWDEAARMQRDAFAELRGEDQLTGRLIARVPRTTVRDVRQLAAYWQNGLARVGERHRADISYRHVLERWKAAVAQVDRIPLNADPTSVYAHNVDFWEAVMTIAIQVAVTAEAPTRWQLAKEATRKALHDLPHTLRSTVGDFLAGVLKKPLIYAGVGLGGIALILLLRRPGASASTSPSETRP
jgi:hypothetical protein